MTSQFKKVFLVCLDFEDEVEVNYVLNRTSSLETARQEAERIRQENGQEVYITWEYIISAEPGNLNRCGCPGGFGVCRKNPLCVCNEDCSCKNFNSVIPVAEMDSEEEFFEETSTEEEID